jgi:hypothetical protein
MASGEADEGDASEVGFIRRGGIAVALRFQVPVPGQAHHSREHECGREELHLRFLRCSADPSLVRLKQRIALKCKLAL